jgi:acetyl esterase
MPVLPPLRPLLDAMNTSPPPSEDLPIAEARARTHEMMMTINTLATPGPRVAEETDHEVPVEGGVITVRMYRPTGEAPFPGLLYVHGGGFWTGTLEHFDDLCRALAVDVDCVVASVDYRLAPEAKFPIAAEDCYTALEWVTTHAAVLGIDASRLAVTGASAGGNLAAAVTLMARDRGGPPIAFQLLEIPLLDMTMSQPSIKENGEGYFLTEAGLRLCVGHYLRDRAEARGSYASPLLADDLSDLPPALVMTAEFDPLRDEGELYAARLADAGVPVELIRWDGHVHGCQSMAALIPDEVAVYHTAMTGALRQAFGIRGGRS